MNDAGVDAYFPILRRVVTLEDALDAQTASDNLSATVEQAFRLLEAGGGMVFKNKERMVK